MHVIRLKNAELGHKNFSGRETLFTEAGYRDFTVRLSDDQATYLLAEGWVLKNRTETHREHRLHVKLRPDFENVAWIDSCDNRFDVTIAPIPWTLRERSGVSAILIGIKVHPVDI